MRLCSGIQINHIMHLNNVMNPATFAHGWTFFSQIKM